MLGDSYGLLTTRNLLYSLQLRQSPACRRFSPFNSIHSPYTYDELLFASLLSFNREIPLQNLKNHQKKSIYENERKSLIRKKSPSHWKWKILFLLNILAVCVWHFYTPLSAGDGRGEKYDVRMKHGEWKFTVQQHSSLVHRFFTFIFTFQIPFNITSHHIEQHTCFVVRSMKKSLSVWIGYTQHSSSQATRVLWFWQWCWWWNMKFQFVESSLHCQKVGIELHFFFTSLRTLSGAT